MGEEYVETLRPLVIDREGALLPGLQVQLDPGVRRNHGRRVGHHGHRAELALARVGGGGRLQAGGRPFAERGANVPQRPIDVHTLDDPVAGHLALELPGFQRGKSRILPAAAP